MLGKPPTLAYEGIGFDVKTPIQSTPQSPYMSHPASPRTPLSPMSFTDTPVRRPSPVDAFIETEAEPRKSTSSGIFSDYDDLGDFDGRFESMSTLGRRKSSSSHRSRTNSEKPAFSRKPSKGFLGRLKGGIGGSQTQSTSDDKPSPSGGKRLKALRSMGSLKSGRASTASSSSRKPRPPSLPQSPIPGYGLDIESLDWNETIRAMF